VTGSADFFSISGCRDLLFHVQEHGMRLDAIAEFLKQNRLTFMGFSTSDVVLARYRRAFPHDAEGTDLDNWRQFEADNPDSFPNMYQFMVRSEA
jgi:hypothetical protein